MRTGFSTIALLCAAHAALAQQPPSRPGASRPPESCGRADPSYIQIANETGGQPLFLKPSEAGQVAQFMREMSGTNREILLWATDGLDRGPRPFTVPVDSTVERLTFSLSVNREGNTLTITRPSGEPVRAGDADTEITRLSCVQIVTITRPQGGDWHAVVGGTGTFWFQIGVRTELFLTRTEFVKVGGRPGHEGWFRIAGQPLMGSPATLRATLSGPAQTADFRLVAPNGETIALLTMAVEDASDDHEYIGTFELPRGSFRIAVSGVDQDSGRYQRVFPSLFHAEAVEISPIDDTPESLPAGATTAVRFAVRNVGRSASFRIVAVDSRQFVRRVDPQEFTLQTDSAGVITVDLAVPPDAAAGAVETLTITVTSTAGSATTNGTVRHLAIVPPRQ